MQQKAFIETATMLTTFAYLDTIVQSYRLGSLVGYHGTGKSRLVDYWAAQRSKITRVNEVAILRVRAPNQRSLHSTAIVTTVTCIVFSQLWHALQKLAEPLFHERQSLRRQHVGSLYTERQFLSLYRQVETQVDQRHIRAIVIDNAELLDGCTFSWLMELRKEHDPRCALILCARMAPNAKPHEPLAHLLTTSPAAREGSTDPWVLTWLAEDDFRRVLAHLIRANLNATVSTEVDGNHLADVLWKHTQGNWWRLDRLAMLLDEALGPTQGSGSRVITPGVVQRVLPHLEREVP